MRKILVSLAVGVAIATCLSSCTTPTDSSGIDTRSIDKQILAAREQVEELDTARRMMTRGAADGADTREIDKELEAAKDNLVELETARRMMLRGAAN